MSIENLKTFGKSICHLIFPFNIRFSTVSDGRDAQKYPSRIPPFFAHTGEREIRLTLAVIPTTRLGRYQKLTHTLVHRPLRRS